MTGQYEWKRIADGYPPINTRVLIATPPYQALIALWTGEWWIYDDEETVPKFHGSPAIWCEIPEYDDATE